VALISRAIPTINVFFLGLPLKILIGIGLIALALPGLMDGIAGIYRFLISGVGDALGAAAAALPAASVTP